MRVYKAIPSLITSLNLACGSAAVFFALNGEIRIAIFLVIAGAVFDFFDGFAARLLKAVSEFGKQLDSLSDLVSFGFAPAAILYQHIRQYEILDEYFALIVIILVIFSALRLAKFNVDDKQTTEFIGLPTPASALLIISLCYSCIEDTGFLCTAMHDKFFIIGLVAVTAFLMLAPINLFSLKIKSYKLKENVWQVVLAVSSISLLIIFGISGFSLIIILYLGMSILKRILTNKK